MKSLTTPSNLLKNAKFLSTLTHDHNLRSHQPNFMSHHIYDYYHQVNHMHAPDGKRDTIYSLIKGSNKEVWIKVLATSGLD